MAVDTELLFHFSIKYDASEEVVRIIKYLFSDNNHENMEEDEQLVLNFRSDPSDGLYAEKQKEFIEKHCFKPSVSHKFFDTNTETYRYNWRAIAGWLCRDWFRKRYFCSNRVFYLGQNRLYNNQLQDFLDWITPYIDCFEQSEICIGWIKYEDSLLPKLITVKQKNIYDILK